VDYKAIKDGTGLDAIKGGGLVINEKERLEKFPFGEYRILERGIPGDVQAGTVVRTVALFFSHLLHGNCNRSHRAKHKLSREMEGLSQYG